MVHQATRRRVFDTLLETLGSAAEGSRELDIVVSYLLGDTSSETGQMIQLLVEEGYSWDIVAELLDADLPPYTTSLDAALPGENIVLALHSPKRARWAAVHRSESGEQTLVWALRECLARRGAALKAQRATLLAQPPRAAPRPARPAPGAPARGWSRPGAASAAGETAAAEPESEEWKILF